MAKIANENAESWLRTIIEAGQGCQAILAAGLAGFAGFSAAEHLRVKSIRCGYDSYHAIEGISVPCPTAKVGGPRCSIARVIGL
jgi:hypothetical protein